MAILVVTVTGVDPRDVIQPFCGSHGAGEDKVGQQPVFCVKKLNTEN